MSISAKELELETDISRGESSVLDWRRKTGDVYLCQVGYSLRIQLAERFNFFLTDGSPALDAVASTSLLYFVKLASPQSDKI